MGSKPSIKHPALKSWVALNAFVMNTDDEAILKKLLAEELKGRRRVVFANRIQSRLARVRLNRERAHLREQLS